MPGPPPDYNNIRWGGPQGLRVPQEVGKATLAIIKETNIDVGGAGTTNSINLDPSQSLSSYYTLTNAGSGTTTVNFAVVKPGHVFTVWNNTAVSAVFRVAGKTGITVATVKRAILVHDRVLGDIARVTADT